MSAVHAASGDELNIRLAGIVNLPGNKVALLQESKRRTGYLLREGERDGQIEMKTISPAELTVTLEYFTNRNLVVAMEAATNRAAIPMPTIVFENAEFHSVAPIYQQLCKRTVLEHPQTPDCWFTFSSSAENQADALRDFEKALAEKGLVLVPDGEKFVMIGPGSTTSTLVPHSPQTNSAETNSSSQSTSAEVHASELIPAGTIDFRGANFYQAFELYGMLIGHNIDRTHLLQGPVQGDFFLLMQTPISRAEAIYALHTLLSWRDVNVITQADGSITAIRSAR